MFYFILLVFHEHLWYFCSNVGFLKVPFSIIERLSFIKWVVLPNHEHLKCFEEKSARIPTVKKHIFAEKKLFERIGRFIENANLLKDRFAERPSTLSGHFAKNYQQISGSNQSFSAKWVILSNMSFE